jgi:hypothetical protein
VHNTLNPTPAGSTGSGNIRVAGYGAAVLALPLFAVVALLMGKEAGWDFQNYHWYDPYALLHGRVGFDIAVAHHATYYNPLLDVPLFVIGTHFAAWVAGAWLGVQAGMAAALLGAIAYRLIPIGDARTRLAVAILLALAGMFGGGALGEVGKTSNDIATGLGALAALLLLIARFPAVLRADHRDLMLVLLPAGILAGASPGLKLTTAPYAVGFAVALLTLPGSPLRRLIRTTAFGIGVLVGIAAVGGFWFWTMWRFSGNPVFPYFNDFFHSPLVPPGSYRDPTFLPKDWTTRLVFPFAFSLDSLKVAEWKFRDIHIAIAYVLAPLAGLAALLKFRPVQSWIDPIAARLLLVMAAGTYLVWLTMFAIYRYLIPLEMLSPIIIVTAISLLPLKRNVAIALAAILLVGAQVLASPGHEFRFGWAGRYVEVAVPPLADPDNTMILMTETVPAAYVIPAFPPAIPFLRIQGWLVGSKDTTSGFGAAMHRRVAEHQGPLYALQWPRERAGTVVALADYGLALDDGACRPVETNIEYPLDQNLPLLLCPLIRKSP